MRLLVKTPRVPENVAEYQGEAVVRLAGKLLEGTSPPEWLDAELAASLYYAFYLPLPALEEAVEERIDLKRLIVKAAIEDAGFWRVKPDTVVDRIASAVASAVLIERLARSLPKQSQKGLGEEGDAGGEDAVRRAVSAALQQAERDTRIAKRVESVINSSTAGSSSELAFEDVLAGILELARKTDVSNILEKLEGVKVPAGFTRKTERYTRGWIDGLELGGDLERIHPSQLALPDEAFYPLYAESRLLLYKKVFTAREGPIYVLLDKSGSMSGSKIDWARAVAVALFQVAVREGRPFYARFFDALPHSLLKLEGRIKPRDVVALLSYLGTVKAGGGTDITRALAAAASDLEQGRVKRQSEVVLVTDGEDKVSETVLEGILSRGRVNLHTVMIGGDNNSLKSISATYMSVVAPGEGDIIKVVEAVDKASRGARRRRPSQRYQR